MTHENLTLMEIEDLNDEINLADGHPRFTPFAWQEQVFGRLSERFAETAREDYDEVQSAFLETFLRSVGESFLPGRCRYAVCYASSVAIEIVARVLRNEGERVALIEPTFDNIPDLLRSTAISLRPVREDHLEGWGPSQLKRLMGGTTTLFLTLPNNPTGFSPPAEWYDQLGAALAHEGHKLVVDCSFRGFDDQAVNLDLANRLTQQGLDFILIEDTGKLFPSQELKAGVIVASGSWSDRVWREFSNVILTWSPFVLGVLTDLSRGFADHREDLTRLIARNRQAVRDGLWRFVTPHRQESQACVEFLRLAPDLASTQTAIAAAKAAGVAVLPGGPFYWDNPSSPPARNSLRIALSRDPEYVDEGVTRLNAAWSGLVDRKSER